MCIMLCRSSYVMAPALLDLMVATIQVAVIFIVVVVGSGLRVWFLTCQIAIGCR